MPAPTGNDAFDAARAGGIVDTFLSFPDVREAKAKVYDYIRKATMDQVTQAVCQRLSGGEGERRAA